MRNTPATAAALLLTLATVLSAGALHAQSMLRMEITMDKKGKRSDKHASTTTLAADGRRAVVLSELSDGTVSQIIYEVADKRMTTIVTDKDGERTAIRLPTVKVPKKIDGATFPDDIRPTGETKQILGYTAEKMLVTQDGQTSEVWIADVPGYDAALFAESMGMDADMSPPEIDGYDNPAALETHTTSKNGKEVTHMIVTEIASGSDVDMDLFEVPAGVQLTDMSAMLKGFGG